MSVDVFIVGAGPAGLAAAITTAAAGLSVEIADTMRPPIDKACGEGLMPDALADLEKLGIDIHTIPSMPFRGISFFGRDVTSTACFTTGTGKGTRRTTLNQLLIERATELGVHFRWQTTVRGLQKQTVELDCRRVTARWIIGADGHQSQIRRMAGLKHRTVSSKRIGLRQHFHIAPWSEMVEIYWGEHSQAYITPVASDEICIAILTRHRRTSFAEEMAQFPRLLQRLGSAQPSDAVRGSLTLDAKVTSVTKGNIALVGDASGAVDALTGEGIALGFRQAVALAHALSTEDMEGYCNAHAEIGRLPHLMSRTMRLMDSSAIVRNHVLQVFERKPSLFNSMLKVHIGGAMPRLLGH